MNSKRGKIGGVKENGGNGNVREGLNTPLRSPVCTLVTKRIVNSLSLSSRVASSIAAALLHLSSLQPVASWPVSGRTGASNYPPQIFAKRQIVLLVQMFTLKFRKSGWSEQGKVQFEEQCLYADSCTA